MKTINQRLVESGVPTSSHYSDLYCQLTPESRKILDGYEHKENVKTFRSAVDGTLWLDIPFACDDYWYRRLQSRSVLV